MAENILEVRAQKQSPSTVNCAHVHRKTGAQELPGGQDECHQTPPRLQRIRGAPVEDCAGPGLNPWFNVRSMNKRLSI